MSVLVFTESTIVDNYGQVYRSYGLSLSVPFGSYSVRDGSFGGEAWENDPVELKKHLTGFGWGDGIGLVDQGGSYSHSGGETAFERDVMSTPSAGFTFQVTYSSY